MRALRRLFKIILITLISLFFLILAFSYIARRYFEKEVTQIIVSELNGSLRARVEVSDVDFTVFYSFPRASLDFKNVVVYSSPDFNSSEFTDGDKVLYAKSISLRFNIIDLYYHRYDIKSVVLNDTYLWVLTDSTGHDNYRIWKETSDTSASILSVSLEKIVSSNLFLWYGDAHNKISGFVEDLEFAGQYRSGDLIAVSRLEGNIQSFEGEGFKYVQKIPFKISTNLLIQDTASYFTNTELQSHDLELKFDCSIGYAEKLSYSLNLKEGSTSVDALRWFFPDTTFKSISAYQPSGDFLFSGKAEKKASQAFGSAKFHLFSKNISAEYNNVRYNTSGLIYFDFPNLTQFDSYSVKSDAFKISVDSKNWAHLSFLYKDSPEACPQLTLDCQFAFNENSLIAFVPDSVTQFTGGISGTLSGQFGLCSFDTLPDLSQLKSSIECFNISAHYPNANIDGMNGRLVLENKALQIPSVSLKLNNSSISASCLIHSIDPFLGVAGAPLMISASLKADTLDYNMLYSLYAFEDDPEIQPQRSDVPDRDYRIKVHLNAGLFKYDRYLLSDLVADFTVLPDSVQFNVSNCKTRFGSLLMDGQYSLQNKTLDFNSDFKNLQIAKLFSEFNEFDQTYLTSKNISGLLSGRVVAHIPLTDSFAVIRPKLNIVSELTIENGKLVNFEPALEMSKFVSEDELSSISFSKISNVFSIRNDSLFIPKMQISSSIADFSVSGEQSLDNSFDYKIQILLNKVISLRRKKKAPVEEFGEVEDDGLGRTTLPLRIYGTPDDFKVVYDRKSAKEAVKVKWKAQSEELKNILKDEFNGEKSPKTGKPVNENVPQDFEFNWDK